MYEILDILEKISLLIVILYIVFWFNRRDAPTDFHKVRNHLQSITHPHLRVRGHGSYFIEFIENDQHFYDYFRTMGLYKEKFDSLKEDSSIKIIKHGLSSQSAWEKWEI